MPPLSTELPGRREPESLVAALGPDTVVINLDEEPDSAGDIAEYVWNQLTAGAWADHQDAARDVAKNLATMAMADAGAFRFAKTVSSTLRGKRLAVGAELLPQLETLAGQAVTLRLHDEAHAEQKVFTDEARELLTALAFGEFGGLPARDVWPAVASALSAAKHAYVQSDVDGVLVQYGKYIVESGEAGQAVYRLYRHEVGERLREELNRPDAPQTIAASLIALASDQSIGGKEPERTNPYLLAHLAGYAVLGGPPSIRLYDELAAGKQQAWLPQLGAALQGLAVTTSEQGRHDDAVELAGRACDRYRTLFELNRARYTVEFGDSLNELFITLDKAGRPQEAEKAILEAITLNEELANQNFPAFASSLASVLYNLGLSRGRRQEWTSAIDPLRRAVDTLDRSGDVLVAYRQDLARDLYTLTYCHVQLGTGAEAVTIAERAVGIYRELSAGGSDEMRKHLAEALELLSGCMAQAHRLEDAIKPQVEAAEMQVNRCLANPAVLPDLTRTFDNLYTTLDEAGRVGDARPHVESALEQLREQHPAVIQLRRLLARWANREGDLKDAVLQEWQALEKAQAKTDEFAVMAICYDLHHLYGEDAETTAYQWTHVVGQEVHSWMSISHEQGAALYEWLPTASREVFVAHRGALLAGAIRQALTDMIALVPTGFEVRYRRYLLDAMRRPHADYSEAAAGARIAATAEAWLNQPDWNESRAFLEAHWNQLSSTEAEQIFAKTVAAHPEDRAAWVHRALLRLVREFGVDHAYGLVTDRDQLLTKLDEVQQEASGEALLPYSWLFMADSPSADRWALLAIANAYASDFSEAEEAVRQFAAIASPDELHEQLGNMQALAHEHPDHADALLNLAHMLESS